MIVHNIGKSVLFVATRLMLPLTNSTTLVILRVTIVTILELYHTSIYPNMIVLHIGKSVLFVATRLMLLLTSLTTLVILLAMIVITLELYHINI